MSFKVGEAYVELKAKHGQLDAELRVAKNKVAQAVTGMTSEFGRLGGAIGKITSSIFNMRNALVAMGTAFVGAKMFQAAIAGANEFELAVSKLNAIVKSTGGAAGYTTAELVKMASALESVTTYSDNAVMEGQAILLTFKNIREDAFKRTIAVALDMAQVMGTDVRSAAVQLGKALNDPVANLGALSRSGVQFTKDQKELIKSLWESGRVLEAQNIILQELESEFGGVSKAAVDTFGGALDRLKNYLSDLTREFGFAITGSSNWVALVNAMTEGVGGLINAVHDGVPKIEGFMDSVADYIAETVADIIDAIEFVKREFENIKAAARSSLPVFGSFSLFSAVKQWWQKREQELNALGLGTAQSSAGSRFLEMYEKSKADRKLREIRKELEQGAKAWELYSAGEEQATNELEKFSKKASSSNKHLEQLNNWIESLRDEVDPFRAIGREIKMLDEAMRAGLIKSTEEYNQLLDALLEKDLGTWGYCRYSYIDACSCFGGEIIRNEYRLRLPNIPCGASGISSDRGLACVCCK